MSGKNKTLLESALEYCELGLPVFPCNPKSKAPLISGGEGFKDASSDPGMVRGWWKQWPEAAIGMPTGERTGWFVTDLDCKAGQANGVAEWPKLVAQHQRDKVVTLMSRTPSGGLHQFFQWVEGVRNVALHKLWAGVEIKGEGGYVLVPPSTGYKWMNEGHEAIAAPEWLLEMILAHCRRATATAPRAVNNDVDRGTIEAALEVIPSDDYHVWFEVGSALHSALGVDGYSLFESWSRKSTKFRERECRRKWKDCGKVSGYSIGTLWHHAGAASPGWDERHYAATIEANARDDAPEWLREYVAAKGKVAEKKSAVTKKPKSKTNDPTSKGPGHKDKAGSSKASDDSHLPVIIVRDGELLGILNKAEDALLMSGVAIYQRSGELVMPDKRIRDDSIKRDTEATTLFQIRPEWLVQLMGQTAAWAKPVKGGSGLRAADPPTKYAVAMLARPPSKWRFPKLLGVISAPTLDREGGIIEEPGYHAGSELLLDFAKGAFPKVPKRPSRKDALAAIALLNHPLRGFPFDGEEEKGIKVSPSRSVALSAMLSALIRTALRTVPLHGFDAPTAGTGKSILAETAALLVAGCKPASMSQGKSPEEDEKRLSTALHAGDQVIMIDNCQHQVTGDFLCSMLTQQKVQARILGQSERRVLPCASLVVCNGNNITFAGDVTRRTVRCGLDAKSERPDQRVFDFDFSEEILRDRPALVIAGLTVLRAFVVAGKPGLGGLTPMGSFADWAWVRGALVWLGQADPALTREQILEADPRRADLSGVLEAWFQAFGTDPVALAAIGQFNGHEGEKTAVRTLLTEMSGKPVWNARSVGWWLRRNARRIVEGRCFMPHAALREGVSWRIVQSDHKLVSRSGSLELHGSGGDVPF